MTSAERLRRSLTARLRRDARLANPISCSFRMSFLSGDLLLVDGAPSARRLESEADVESEVGVESEAGVGTESL